MLEKEEAECVAVEEFEQVASPTCPSCSRLNEPAVSRKKVHSTADDWASANEGRWKMLALRNDEGHIAKEEGETALMRDWVLGMSSNELEVDFAPSRSLPDVSNDEARRYQCSHVDHVKLMDEISDRKDDHWWRQPEGIGGDKKAVEHVEDVEKEGIEDTGNGPVGFGNDVRHEMHDAHQSFLENIPPLA